MKLGWLPDKPDARDKHVRRLQLPAAIPASASMREMVVEILDQGNTSSCVAHAWAQALRIADMVSGVKDPPLPSREYLYWNARAYDGGAIEDQGTQLRSCAQGVVKFGRPAESVWPFNEAAINERPSWEAYRQGYDARGPAGYYRVSTVQELCQALAANKPVVGGASVGNSIFDYTGGVYDPSPNESSVGGHALAFVGFSPTYIEIAGSWGTGYGERGFMRVSYAWAGTFTDMWAVSDV